MLKELKEQKIGGQGSLGDFLPLPTNYRTGSTADHTPTTTETPPLTPLSTCNTICCGEGSFSSNKGGNLLSKRHAQQNHKPLVGNGLPLKRDIVYPPETDKKEMTEGMTEQQPPTTNNRRAVRLSVISLPNSCCGTTTPQPALQVIYRLRNSHNNSRGVSPLWHRVTTETYLWHRLIAGYLLCRGITGGMLLYNGITAGDRFLSLGRAWDYYHPRLSRGQTAYGPGQFETSKKGGDNESKADVSGLDCLGVSGNGGFCVFTAEGRDKASPTFGYNATGTGWALPDCAGLLHSGGRKN